MFKLSFKKTFSIKTAHFKPNFFSFLNSFWIQRGLRSKRLLSVGFSKFENKLCLFFFKNKIRQELSTDINKAMTLNDPLINPSLMSRIFLKDRTFMFLRFMIQVRKVFLNPIKKFFSCVRNVKDRSEIWRLVSVVFSWVNSVNTERSFTIYNTGKVSQFKRVISNFIICNFRHLQSPLCVVASTVLHKSN